VWGETKRMLFNKNFLAAWLIACISIAIGQMHIPQELRIRSRGTERHSASN